jgi:hypothetical protein
MKAVTLRLKINVCKLSVSVTNTYTLWAVVSLYMKALILIKCVLLKICQYVDVMVVIYQGKETLAWVCGRSLTGIVGSNPAEGIDVCLWLVSCVVR